MSHRESYDPAADAAGCYAVAIAALRAELEAARAAAGRPDLSGPEFMGERAPSPCW